MPPRIALLTLLLLPSMLQGTNESTSTPALDQVNWNSPVYQTGFDSETVLRDWRLEGGVSMRIENKRLLLETKGINTAPARDHHLVAWLEKEIPDNFYLEFDFRPKNKQQGLAIVFLNTRGIHGESIFDENLAPRDGIFVQYHSGDLNGYHLSYWSGERKGSNLRKNKGFHLVASGEDPVASDTTDKFHRIGILKKDASIRYYVDNALALEYTDDGKEYGPAWINSGWIGLRQMDHAHWCEYDNLSIYPLLP
ncbi:DUF1961 family protein [Coraliomargarita algicola]|uniref:DUF1961 family protein n=1 Tax=Coraliomargarita algicola TaxID=3092156 RepID=A0ABZ0RIU9_9BACT|nr:DUF1961 family protein [Coraliomargarita sp. J2-16]WPJ95184.1 DUF1961 family protein [Coraliomargarita sp. J2-16]